MLRKPPFEGGWGVGTLAPSGAPVRGRAKSDLSVMPLPDVPLQLSKKVKKE